jgi:hypothetical protein
MGPLSVSNLGKSWAESHRREVLPNLQHAGTTYYRVGFVDSAQQFLKAQPGPQGLAHRRGSEQRELHFFEPIGGRTLGSGDAPDVGIAAIHSPSVNPHEQGTATGAEMDSTPIAPP